MHLVLQVIVALLAVALAAVFYKASNLVYSCYRNSKLLRDHPGPAYGFFLGVIPDFAGNTPITRCVTRDACLHFSCSVSLSKVRACHLQGHASLGGTIWAGVPHTLAVRTCEPLFLNLQSAV